MGSLTDDVLRIPVMDLSHGTAQIGDLLVNAVSEWGFVFVRSVGSGFTPEVIDRTFELVRLGFCS